MNDEAACVAGQEVALANSRVDRQAVEVLRCCTAKAHAELRAADK